MLEAAAFLVVIAGLTHPQWVRRPRAFGAGIVLTVVLILAGATGITSWQLPRAMIVQLWGGGDGYETIWSVFWGMLGPMLKVATVLCLISAYWPGEAIFGRPGSKERPTDSGPSRNSRPD